MKPLLFIHGTGTRRPAYNQAVSAATKQIQKHLPEFEIKECYWGEPHGSKQWSDSLPNGPTNEQIEEAKQVVLWQHLTEDPYFQLRIVEANPAPPAPSIVAPPGSVIWQKLENLALDEVGLSMIEKNNLGNFWAHALDVLLTETAPGTNNLRWKKAVRETREPATDVRRAIAYYLIAATMNNAREMWVLPLADEERSKLFDSVVDALGGVGKGIGSLFAGLLVGSAMVLANPLIRADREDFSTMTGPAAGDILLYQARGEGIRNYIEEAILRESEKSGPVVIVAHSLGGIATVDLLITKNLWPHVKALVTVGSQAAYLYEIGALWSRERGQPLPEHFPEGRWLNIFNRWDFLSYPAERVFPHHARDHEVSGLLPFPASHSAYWKNPDTWTAIRRFVQ
jgi:hypothetical protein